MKKYYIISTILFILTFMTAQIGVIVFGGEGKVPVWLTILFVIVIANSFVATTIYTIKKWKE